MCPVAKPVSSQGSRGVLGGLGDGGCQGEIQGRLEIFLGNLEVLMIVGKTLKALEGKPIICAG